MTSAVVTTGMTGNTYKALFRKQILRVNRLPSEWPWPMSPRRASAS